MFFLLFCCNRHDLMTHLFEYFFYLNKILTSEYPKDITRFHMLQMMSRTVLKKLKDWKFYLCCSLAGLLKFESESTEKSSEQRQWKNLDIKLWFLHAF